MFLYWRRNSDNVMIMIMIIIIIMMIIIIIIIIIVMIIMMIIIFSHTGDRTFSWRLLEGVFFPFIYCTSSWRTSIKGKIKMIKFIKFNYSFIFRDKFYFITFYLIFFSVIDSFQKYLHCFNFCFVLYYCWYSYLSIKKVNFNSFFHLYFYLFTY